MSASGMGPALAAAAAGPLHPSSLAARSGLHRRWDHQPHPTWLAAVLAADFAVAGIAAATIATGSAAASAAVGIATGWFGWMIDPKRWPRMPGSGLARPLPPAGYLSANKGGASGSAS